MIKKTSEPCLVYIVDDDDLVRKGLARLMRAGGFRAKTYASPEIFLQEVGTESPACILLDITMPRMTGLQVQAQLKERGNTIPVIAVSARDDDDTRQRARDLDAQCFLRKPIDDRVLLEAIAWAMKTQGPGTGPAAVRRFPT